MSSSGARPGTVYLVGAGPGDPGLVTRRALELVRTADVLLVDRLASPWLVAQARADARCIDVGKTAGDHAMPQEQINERLVDEARAGRSVVRLKGGDPYVFGRGGEEALHCRAADVPFEVVPAVTSAFAACADAGMPVTHRDIARNVTVVTASAGRDGTGDPDYGWLAQSDGTLVLLMGLRRVAHVASRLVEEGMSPDRPAAVVARGTTNEQRTVTATIGTLAAAVAAADLPSPAIIVVGEVVRLREQLDWFEHRPLFGVRVAVTRARAQASELVARLDELGATVVELPTIRIEQADPRDLDELIAQLPGIDTLVFTSANGVGAFFGRLALLGRDSRTLAGVRVAVVGGATADACAAHGIAADVVAPSGARTSMGLLQELRSLPLAGTRCAVVRAEAGDERFLDGLRKLGADVRLVVAYRTVAEPLTAGQVEQLRDADLVTFTSASTVQTTTALVGSPDALPPAVTIGPGTSEAAHEAGVPVLQQAADPSIDSLVAAVLDVARAERGSSLLSS